LAAASSAFAGFDLLVPDRENAMAIGSRTSQPIGHYKFCLSLPAECAVKSPVRGKAQVTETGWNVIREVNADVNARVEPMTDDELYGRDEVWAYPGEAGDCEDYVLLKRKQLLARGFAEADLLITVVRKYDGTGHAVLTVSTTEGDFVLDNLDPAVRRWSETPYHYIKRQSARTAGAGSRSRTARKT
jgi:predicted transglutaminase-like cysteine proteinase